MNAPLVWVLLPAIVALAVWLLRRRAGLAAGISGGVCLALAGFAWLSPIGEPVDLIFFGYQLDPALDFVGRRLILENSDRPLLAFLFFFAGLWFLGSAVIEHQPGFVSLGLGVLSLFVAALAVEPFLYAALLVEMAVLLCVPLLVPPGRPFGQGLLRFLIFQTLAMPFLLLAGWSFGRVESNPSDLAMIQLSVVFFGLGFAFWLAVFPFYTWIPLLAEQSHPYVAAFVLFLFSTVSLMLGQSFLSGFGWLRTSTVFYDVIELVGLLMIVTAGVGAAFQRDMARLMGYVVIVETGFSLLATSLASPFGQQLFSVLLLPRVLGLGVLSMALAVLLRQARSTRFIDMLGISRTMPVASAALAVSALTLAGLPLLAAFPIRMALLEALAERSFLNAAWALVGIVGMLFSTFRALAVLIRGSSSELRVTETRAQVFLLSCGILVILLAGIFPQVFVPMMQQLLAGNPVLP